MSQNITIDLPTLLSWNKDGQPLRAGILLAYSSVIFDTIRRRDAGNYPAFTCNFASNDTLIQIGNDTGYFSLEVICEFTINQLYMMAICNLCATVCIIGRTIFQIRWLCQDALCTFG